MCSNCAAGRSSFVLTALKRGYEHRRGLPHTVKDNKRWTQHNSSFTELWKWVRHEENRKKSRLKSNNKNSNNWLQWRCWPVCTTRAQVQYVCRSNGRVTDSEDWEEEDEGWTLKHVWEAWRQHWNHRNFTFLWKIIWNMNLQPTNNSWQCWVSVTQLQRHFTSIPGNWQRVLSEQRFSSTESLSS